LSIDTGHFATLGFPDTATVAGHQRGQSDNKRCGAPADRAPVAIPDEALARGRAAYAHCRAALLPLR
jgi:hypothetical protein